MRYTYRTVAALVILAVVALSFPGKATAQAPAQPPASPPEPNNYSTWVRREVNKALAAEKAIAENGNGVANQKESPSSDQASTSLVDTSAASDFVALALNLTGLRAQEGDNSKPSSGSVTVTLYSLIAAVKGVSLTDPAFYKRGTNWRRLALTIGSEESKAADHFTDKPSTNLGAKLLILNSRDVYSAHAQTQLGTTDSALDDYATLEQMVTNDLQCAIFRALDSQADRTGKFADCRNDPAFLGFLKASPFDQANWPKNQAALEKNAGAMQEVSRLMGRLAAGRTVATDKITAAVDQIHRGRQLAIAYFTKQREDDGTDEHRAELIFDYGLSERLNWTLNTSIDYSDRKLREDTRSGRFATEFQAKLSNAGSQMWSARPVTLSGSGEASRDPDSEWLIRAQVKLVVPVTTGVDIPIAYSYANRDAEGIVSGSRLKFSLAVDPVRLRERFR